MDYEKIIARIEELEQVEKGMAEISKIKRLELAQKEAEANEIKKIINDNIFENLEESKELQELKITKKWLDIYSKNEREELEE